MKLGFVAAVIALWAGSAAATEGQGERYVDGEIIAKLAQVQDHAEYTALLTDVGGRDMGGLRASPLFRKIKLDPGVKMEDALARLNASRTIQYAEPNFIYRAWHAPIDKRLKDQWSLRNTGQKIGKEKIKGTPGADIKMFEAWEAVPGAADAAANVKVAVIDTGINLKHKDLRENIWTNPGELGAWMARTPAEAANAVKDCHDKSCNGIDDDGNGYVDDFQGWNWAVKQQEGKPVVGNNNPQDDNMHGSHCAGVIGARHNDRGIAGINNRVQLMALRFLDKKGSGTLEGGVEAIAYATRMGAQVISASWGSTEGSRALEEIIAEATNRGVLFVAAAGNSANDNDAMGSYPANYGAAGVLSVVASDLWDGRAYFSSYGRNATHVAAPGLEILSTVKGNGYEFLSGTSMATPHVSGLAAMLIGVHPELAGKPLELRKRIMDTSDVTPQLLSRSQSGGRINALNALLGTVPVAHERPSPDAVWGHQLDQDPIESAHPYANNQRAELQISHEGAKWIQLIFGRHSIENWGDRIEIYDGEGNLFDVITGFGTRIATRPIKGSVAKVVLVTDATVTAWGYEILGYNYVP
jgi:subtilisin family serine protease